MSKIIKTQYYVVGQSPFVYAGYKCNNRCVFCFEADREFPYKTTQELKEEIKLIRKKFDFINFMGQEPTLRDDIVELIDCARVKGFQEIGITTNGRMFAYPDFTQNILKSGLSQIVLTVAGHRPEIHDKQTLAQGSFNQALAGIRNILKYKKQNLSFIINIMVSQKNYKDLNKMVDFYTDLGIREINIGHIMPLNKTIKNSRKIVAQMKDVVPFLIKAQEKHGSEVKFLFVEYPACVLPRDYQDMGFPCLEENPDKRRIKICNQCRYKKTCAGIHKNYLALYGDKEFKL